MLTRNQSENQFKCLFPRPSHNLLLDIPQNRMCMPLPALAMPPAAVSRMAHKRKGICYDVL